MIDFGEIVTNVQKHLVEK